MLLIHRYRYTELSKTVCFYLYHARIRVATPYLIAMHRTSHASVSLVTPRSVHTELP